jgi:transposase
MASISRRVQKLLASGISPEGLADRIGVSLATIYRWQKKSPSRTSMSTTRALDALLGVNRKAKVR